MLLSRKLLGALYKCPRTKTSVHFFEDIQKAVPNLSRLEISSETQCDLRRVLGFSGLSSLELNSDAHRGSDPEPENLILDLGMLPASLMDLETVCYNVDPDSFEQVRCTHLDHPCYH